MKIVSAHRSLAQPILKYNSIATSSIELGHGAGENHVYALFFDANSQIGAHPTGFCQLFIVVSGSGWVAGADGERITIEAGEAAFFEKGEIHSKGSSTGMQVIMVQSETMTHPSSEQ